VTIARIPPFPVGSGGHYTDTLPVTGAKYYYRFRHVRTGWTAGSYGPWSRAATAQFLDNVNLAAASPVPTTFVPTSADGTTTLAAFGDTSTGTFGPTGRADQVFNGDCEQGLSYWVAIQDDMTSLDAILVPFTTANLQVITASPYKGTKSLRFTSDSGHNSTLVQAASAVDAVRESLPLYFRVKDNETYRVRAAIKSSTASNIVLGLSLFNSNRTFNSLVANPGSIATTTSFVEYETVVKVPASGVFWACITIRGDLVASKDYTVDDIHCWKIPDTQQTLTDAATITVDLLKGNQCSVTLAGNRTMGAATGMYPGLRVTFVIIQDGTGNRTINFATNYPKLSWSDTGNTASKRSTISAIYDGTNWNQDGAQSPYI
jgi:hypothetical protein